MNMRKALVAAVFGIVAVAAMNACAPPTRPAVSTVSGDDAAISARVRTALNSGGLDPAQIDVSTSNGVVRLTGFARDQQTIERAETEARRVPGVTAVLNDLQLLGGGPERRR